MPFPPAESSLVDSNFGCTSPTQGNACCLVQNKIEKLFFSPREPSIIARDEPNLIQTGHNIMRLRFLVKVYYVLIVSTLNSAHRFGTPGAGAEISSSSRLDEIRHFNQYMKYVILTI